MRIGIDARVIAKSNNNGEKANSVVALYVYHLIKNLIHHDKENQYVLFFDSRMNKKDTEKFKSPNVEVVYFPFSTYKNYLPYAYSQFIVSGFLAKQKLDVFHACSGTMPLTYLGPTVLTLFELAPSGLDKVAQKKIIHKAKIIITQNEELKKKIAEHYKIDPNKIIVTQSCETIENKDTSRECIEKYLEIYRVAHNVEIKENYLLKLPFSAISKVASPFKKALNPLGKIIIYPIKSIKSKKKK